MLFSNEENTLPIAEDAFLLKGFLLGNGEALLLALNQVVEQSPFRFMVTPGGHSMSVAMTNCGPWGWVTDGQGYRYQMSDPVTKEAWPTMPAIFMTLAQEAAEMAGFPNFLPDACLINRYSIGAKLSLHQDKDETDFSQPIVSFSLGLPAIFDFGGKTREAPKKALLLEHGDVVVWGGKSRLNYHGVRSIKAGSHPVLGEYRINITFRRCQ
ncbi:DNA oxidative demethylase AlkB [Providencia vermicola]|uniref:DNA oxidative demethylase AlkB n=2 Tax=Providencia TaxID=586 RepID=A0AAI9HZA7_PROST|nr:MULTISPECIES: DNA oxidative demethylase AlkB [Providencia]ELR5043172.1 DNA oxidative demethylase AlkB [Providencia rettgeri]ELR5035404.1 DNA oxidative demethylase AlkB [Providencia stuartii]ELR5119935.1 DNA oxidative demethylase AlkB [Providencia stuartii]ELR5141692.1 DNA oxidative demethylase AlkB [Providencia stuartii]ELR5291044.1 DNA oxidative demethylase AlkB [Providencia stuartii]